MLYLSRLRAAERKADQPIDDSAVIDDMFDFLKEQKDNISEAQGPSAFRDLPAPKVLIGDNKTRKRYQIHIEILYCSNCLC